MRHITLLLILSFLSALTYAGTVPRFEDFPVQESSSPQLVGPNMAPPQAHRYRTLLREAAKDKPNFSGHFTIAIWGCGSGCASWAIINRLNGKVWFPPFYVSVPSPCSEELGNCMQDIEFKANSELVIVTGARNERGGGRYYYRWHNGKLKLLHAQEPWDPGPGARTDI